MLFAKKLLCFQNFYPKLFTTGGWYYIVLEPGAYRITGRGGGGCGGDSCAAISGTPAEGGAGAPGGTFDQQITVTDFTVASIYVGQGGVHNLNGGNGGGGGAPYATGYNASAGGAGGGGGQPSFVIVNNTKLIATGGGGGGGGGGNNIHGQGRYEPGSGGGGGGGYYYVPAAINNNNLVSVPGKTGAQGANFWTAGNAGVQGNITDFSSLYSGQGGYGGAYDRTYYERPGGASAAGGGASGGGGAGGAYNGDYAFGGGGGGGAGGSTLAGGGAGGTTSGVDGNGSAAYNHYTQPIDVWSDNEVLGAAGVYGRGGTTSTPGNSGFIRIARV